MNEVLCVGLFRRDCEDFAGGGRGDERHPGCAIGCTTLCLFAQWLPIGRPANLLPYFLGFFSAGPTLWFSQDGGKCERNLTDVLKLIR